MRVLITNLFLANNSGSEVVVELLADGLRRAGHQPMILSPVLGPQADRMRTRGHIIVDRVAALPAAPDVIHAQHVTVALSALAAFPETPAVFACHSANFEVEAPRPHPTGVGVNDDVGLILRRHLRNTSIPFEDAAVKRVHLLKKRNLELKSRLSDRFANKFAKLGHDDLIGFLNGVESTVGDEKRNKEGDGNEAAES